jgi:hypothetical protein
LQDKRLNLWKSRIRQLSDDSPTAPAELAAIVNKWISSSYSPLASAAFAKAAHLQHLNPAAARTKVMLRKLARLWSEQLPTSDPQGMIDVLRVCGKLQYMDTGLWKSTLPALVQTLQDGKHAVTAQSLVSVLQVLAALGNKSKVPGVPPAEVEAAVQQLCSNLQLLVTQPQQNAAAHPEHISTALWACAELRISPGAAVLDGLLQAIEQPAMLDAATPRALSEALWAVGRLHQQCNWQPRLQQLLGEQQLARIADAPQGVAIALLALVWLSSAAQPPAAAAPAAVPAAAAAVPAAISMQSARPLAIRLLQGQVAQQLDLWNAQAVANSMWASAKLGVYDAGFIDRVVAAAPEWLAEPSVPVLTQVAWACKTLPLQEQQQRQLLQVVVQASNALFALPGGEARRLAWQSRVLRYRVHVAATVGSSVAALDMQDLAGAVRELVANSSTKPERPVSTSNISPVGLAMLWEVHAWLVQQQLLDGQGLAGLLSEQQLAEGKAAAAEAKSSGAQGPSLGVAAQDEAAAAFKINFGRQFRR